jgi:ABC-type glycerol-3-phosphate transport system substrate-binding protein
MSDHTEGVDRGVGTADRRRFLKIASGSIVPVAAAGCAEQSAGGGDSGGDSGNSGDSSSEDDATSGSSDDSGEGGEINVIMENVYDTTVVENLLPRWNENHDATVNIESFPFTTLQEKITTQLQADTNTYDVIITSISVAERFAREGLIQDISERVADSSRVLEDEYLDTLWNAVADMNDGIYGVPFYNWALAMIYRKDLISNEELQSQYESNIGETLSIPETIDSYVDVSEFMTLDQNDDGEVDIWGSAMQARKGIKISEEWYNYLYGKGGRFINDGTVVLGDHREEAVEALESYKQNLENAAPPEAANYGFNEARRLMEQGNAFNMLTYNWMYGRLQNTDVGDQISVATIPGGTPVIGVWGWAIPHNISEERADSAWEFIQWVESPEIRTERAREGAAPTCNDVLSNQELIDQFPTWYPVVEETLKNGIAQPTTPGSLEASNELGTQLSLAVTDQKSIENAIDDAITNTKNIMR